MPASSASAATRLSGVAAPALMRGRRDHFGLAEALGRQAHDEARDAAVADQEVRADADDGQRHVFGHGLQERREILLVGRLEQQLGQAAGAEPGDLVHLGIRRHAAAQGAAGRSPSRSNQCASCGSCRRPAEFLGQRIGPLRDVAGAEEDDEIARLGELAHDRRDRLRPVDIARVAMAAGADPRHQRVATSTPSIGSSPAA